MKKKTLFWIALFAAVAAAAGAFYAQRGGGTVAAVYLDGELYDTFDLTAAVIPYEVTIRTEYGVNTLRISHGAVEVAEADCEGQDCVRQGAIHDGLLPIVCLPHRLVIQIEE